MTEINYVRNLSGACLTVVRGAPQLGLPIPPRRKQWEFCTTRSLLAACRRRVEPSCSAIPPIGAAAGRGYRVWVSCLEAFPIPSFACNSLMPAVCSSTKSPEFQ